MAQTRIAVSRLPETGKFLIGRKKELTILTKAWTSGKTNVLSIVAPGGVGKTQLVKRWRAGLLANYLSEGDRVFDWSFYSQGTSDAASSDDFFGKAFEWFGGGEASDYKDPWEKGERLAELVREGRTLLVLDGLEPLQHPPGPMEGRLNDQALGALLKGLADLNPGLCVVTTREAVTELAGVPEPAHKLVSLDILNAQGGAELLREYGVRGPQDELEQASQDYDGHALSLILLGTYLRDRFGGDITKRNRVAWPSGYEEESSAALDTAELFKGQERFARHARKVMASYITWFECDEHADEVSRVAATILRLMGLFNRPADSGCINALREKLVEGLTEPLFVCSNRDEVWKRAVLRLRHARLLAEAAATSPDKCFTDLDAHPLVREYFAKLLGERFEEGKREAHRRLYEHLKESAPEFPDTLREMMPLYHAIVHGCAAGLYQETHDEVHLRRVRRWGEDYSIKKLGAFGADLAAIACFFERYWDRPVDGLSERTRATLMGNAAYRLRGLGRLRECRRPMRVSLDMGIAQRDWDETARRASNLSALHVTLGAVGEAVRSGEQGVLLADRSGDAFQRVVGRAGLADDLHNAGRLDDALAAFVEAEAMQKADKKRYPLLLSVPGFHYCDLMIDTALRELRITKSEVRNMERAAVLSFLEACCDVRERAETTLKWALAENRDLLSSGLDRLTLGRAWLLEAEAVRALGDGGEADRAGLLGHAAQAFDESVSLLREASIQEFLARGRLSRAAYYRVLGDMGRAEHDLAEAEGIAERGEMLIFQIDAALERCRLCLAQDDTEKARVSLERAKALVKKTEAPYKPFVPDWDEWDAPGYVGVIKEGEIVGYHCRNGEIAELEQQF